VAYIGFNFVVDEVNPLQFDMGWFTHELYFGSQKSNIFLWVCTKITKIGID